ncbi:MAG TPA: redoxin domain-containing protein [Terriglobales bacterium]|jgi:peroxiredoxin|nr:redoxin domain-containing protein [Terriglobales bacterium]
MHNLLFSSILFVVLSNLGLCQSTALRIDPACPVSGRKDAAKEIRVTYLPSDASATLKNPKQLTLDVGVNSALSHNNTRSVPFTRGDGSWQATLTQGANEFWLYLIFQVRDAATGQIDNNSGQYWDVVFCIANGKPHFQGVQRQAQSYTGTRFKNGIARAKNYDMAIAVIERYLEKEKNGASFLLPGLWRYKALRDGDTDAAWQKVGQEVSQFLDDHRTDRASLSAVYNYIQLNEDRAPAGLYARMIRDLAAIDPADAETMDRTRTLSQIERERDPRKQAAALDEFIRKNPKDAAGLTATSDRLYALRLSHDVPAAESAFAQMIRLEPNWPDACVSMAAIYIENRQKPEEALKLLDQAAQRLQSGGQPSPDDVNMWYALAGPERNPAILASWRARAYLLQGKGELALEQARIVLQSRQESDDYFYLGQALEAMGEKQKAADAYLEAVTRPSRLYPQQRAQLKHLWAAAKLGTREQLERKIQAKAEERFRQKHYVPALLNQPAPEFDLTTLKGERLRSAELRDKTVVLHLWGVWCAPCIPELRGFADLQRKHPELTVVAVAVSSELQQLRDMIAEQQVESLPVVQSDSLKVLVTEGVPVTYIIDHDRIRLVHQGAMSDVVAYVEADLAALKAE